MATWKCIKQRYINGKSNRRFSFFPLVSRELVKLMCTGGSQLSANDLAVKKLLLDYLPSKLAEMQEKQIKRRFLVPLESWVRELNKDVLKKWMERVNDLPVNVDIFDKKFKDYINNPSEKLGREIWTAVVLGYWVDNLKIQIMAKEKKSYMTTPLARIDITGHFFRPSVQTVWVEKQPPKKEGAIAEIWKERVISAKEQGKYLYNSSLCSLEEAKTEQNQLKLSIGKTSYRDYSSYRANPDLFYSNELPNPMGTQIIPIVNGKDIILAKRAINLDVNPGKWFTFGGFMEPETDIDPKDGYPDIFLCAQREFEEEIGILIDSNKFELIGVVYDLVTPHPECVFIVNVQPEQATAFEREGEEYSKIHTVPLANIEDFLIQESGKIVSTTVAALNIIRQQTNDAKRAHKQYPETDGPTFVWG